MPTNVHLFNAMSWQLKDVQTGFRKVRGTRDQIVNICWIIRKQGDSRKTSTSASLTALKPLTVWIMINYGKSLKKMGTPNHPTCLLRNRYEGQEATVRTIHGMTDWFKIGKGVWQGHILSSAYLTYMQSTSCEMSGWMNHRLESRLLGEISITLDMPLWQKAKRRVKKVT